MEIKIGIQNVSREIVLESEQSLDAISTAVAKSLDGTATTLTLTDEKGRTIIVPSAALAYVELGAEEQRRIGFGVG